MALFGEVQANTNPLLTHNKLRFKSGIRPRDCSVKRFANGRQPQPLGQAVYLFVVYLATLSVAQTAGLQLRMAVKLKCWSLDTSIIRAVTAPVTEAASTSDALVNFFQTTRRYNPERSHLNTRHRDTFKSYITFC
jgi:hypothetical protein